MRGLTTAASIWITAAIGILAGTGFYFPVVIGTIATLGTLSILRLVEARMPVLFFLRHTVRFPIQRAIPEPEYRIFIAEHGFKTADVSYRVSPEAGYVEYTMILSGRDAGAERRIAEALSNKPYVLEFTLAPSGD